MFPNLKVLIWDFDGTLYKPNPELWHTVREAEYKTITNHTKWQKEKVVTEFEKLYKKVYPSATETVANLSGVSTKEAALEMESYYDRRDFVVHDDKLVALFDKLRMYRHFILANGVIAKHKETLRAMGLSPDIFEEMVTSETVGVTKPNDAGFRYIMSKTNLPPEEHMMIGDREMVDLAPAKKLGMKTCLVWAQPGQNQHADIVLPTVYDVEKILI